MTLKMVDGTKLIAEPIVREPTRREKLEAELASLRTTDDPEEETIRRLQDDIDFEKAKRSAKANERVGRVLLDPGQVIFRQMFRDEFVKIDQADKVSTGKTPMTEAQASEARRIASEQVYKACMKSPDWDTFQSWLDKYPLALAAYGAALNEHNSAHRRERESK